MRRLLGPAAQRQSFTRLLRKPSTPRESPQSLHHQAAASHLQLSPAVARALAASAPVVALESTIITHGMPYPDNLKTAREVEAVVRAHGATPATVAILGGKLCVGLEEAELEALAQEGTKAAKCSRRDIPMALVSKRTGSTTVAGTLAIAHLAGLRVFVTGGIGGVHRGAESTMDVSADLIELGRIPHMAVVCAGVKSILDVGKTLEVLETQGVPVVGYGTDAFPAFFTPDSGFPAPARVDSPGAVAALMEAARAARLPSSVLVAVPNPAPAAAQATQAAIDAAVAETEARGLRGQAVTPFILQRVSEVTKGESLRANIELVKHNARVGAQIAVALAKRPPKPPPSPSSSSSSARAFSTTSSSNSSSTSSTTTTTSSGSSSSNSSSVGSTKPQVVVVGGAVMDVIAGPQRGFVLEAGTTTPGVVRQKEGGVGRNVAEGLARLGVPTALVSAVGDDPAGAALLASLRALVGAGAPLVLDGVRRMAGRRTASCVALLDERQDLKAGIADMDIFPHALTPAALLQQQGLLASARLAVADGNLSAEAFAALAEACARHRVPLLFEPTSVAKAALPVKAHALPRVAILKPNVKELAQLVWVLQGRHGHGLRPEEEEGRLERRMEEAEDALGVGESLGAGTVVGVVRPALELVLRAMRAPLQEGGGGAGWAGGWAGQKHVLVTLGAHGLVWGRGPAAAAASPSSGDGEGGEDHGGVEATFFPARPVSDMADCTGAGDTLVAAVAGALVQGRGRGGGMEGAIRLGMAAARRSVQAVEAVPRDLSFAALGEEEDDGGEGQK